MAKEEAAKKKVKRPTPLKRDEQNEKRRINNRGVKTRVKNSVKAFEDVLTLKDAKAIQDALSKAYSVLDKAVKKGVFKANKASRTKARLAAKASK